MFKFPSTYLHGKCFCVSYKNGSDKDQTRGKYW